MSAVWALVIWACCGKDVSVERKKEEEKNMGFAVTPRSHTGDRGVKGVRNPCAKAMVVLFRLHDGRVW